jgi:putative membrane protein
MFQHMLLMLILPPLLLLGVPAWLVRRALRVRGVTPLARALTHPLVAFVVYNVVFLGWHLPVFYNWALVDHDLHIVQHLMFLAAATMMWWPVVNPAPELQRVPEGLLQMAYLFAFAVPATAVSAFITLSDSVLYPFYEEAPRLFGLTALEDQRLGGLLMWIPGMLIFWVAITAVFFRWTKDEIKSWQKAPESRPSRGL